METLRINIKTVKLRLFHLGEWSIADLAREIARNEGCSYNEKNAHTLRRTLARNKPNLSTVARIAKGLGLPYEQIIERVEDED